MSIPIKHDLGYWADMIGTKTDIKRMANKYYTLVEAKETSTIYPDLPTNEEFEKAYKAHFGINVKEIKN